MRAIDVHIQIAKETISSWDQEKDEFAKDFKMRDFEAMNEHSSNLSEMIGKIIEIFYYEPLSFENTSDYRTRERVKNKIILLKQTFENIKESEEEANLPKYQKLIDKAETIIISLIKTVEMIASKQKIKSDRKSNIRKYERKSNKLQLESWKKWIKMEIQEEDPYSEDSNVLKLKDLLRSLIVKH